MEGCRSGLTGGPGKTVYQQWYREFESRPFRFGPVESNYARKGTASSNLALSALDFVSVKRVTKSYVLSEVEGQN